MDSEAAKIDLGAILTGGGARRMGGRKADLDFGGLTLVERVWSAIEPLCGLTVCVGGEEYLADKGVPTIPDLYPGADSMGGIATALKYALDALGPEAYVLVVGCDMPLISPELVAYLATRRHGHDVVAPLTRPGYEPLCSIYRAGIFPVFDERIRLGLLRVRDVFAQVDTVSVGEEELRRIDPALRSFANINRREDLDLLRAHRCGG